MTSTERALLHSALRNDFPTFVHRCFQTVAPGSAFMPNWHVLAIAWHLYLCATGQSNRLIITVPPRSGKSISASIALPAWLLGHDPTRQIINVSYSKDLAADFARQFRLVANAAWYRQLFPQTRSLKDSESEFITTQNGFRLSTSVGGTLTGRGGDVLIVDDPIKPEDAMSEITRNACIRWFQSTLLTRLNDKRTGVVIVIMQRLHENDLVGHLLETDPTGWTHLDLPAIAQEPQDVAIGVGRVHHRETGDPLHAAREDHAVLERIKAEMGSAAFSAQYLQRPVPADGNMVKRGWFRSYDTPPPPKSGDRIVQSWDTALKPAQRNDPSVCTTWRMTGADNYLIDVVRKRIDFPDLRRLAIELYQQHQASTVLIEDTGSGTSLLQELQQVGGINAIARKPQGDKIMRLDGQTATIEAGHVHLPKDAPWLAGFLHEVLAFPSGRHDDQVDSLSQFLTWAAERRASFFDFDFGDPAEDIGVPSFEILAAKRWTYG